MEDAKLPPRSRVTTTVPRMAIRTISEADYLKAYGDRKLLGKGSYGSAFEVKRATDGKVFVVKEVYPQGRGNIGELFKRASREFEHQQLAMKCDPEGAKYIVRVFDSALLVGSNYTAITILMERMKYSLESVPCFKPEWVSQCFQGLAALHNIGMVHRDIFPRNILIGEWGSPVLVAKLSDFGLSCAEACGGAREFDPGQPEADRAPASKRVDIRNLLYCFQSKIDSKEGQAGKFHLVNPEVSSELVKRLGEVDRLGLAAPRIKPQVSVIDVAHDARWFADFFKSIL